MDTENNSHDTLFMHAGCYRVYTTTNIPQCTMCASQWQRWSRVASEPTSLSWSHVVFAVELSDIQPGWYCPVSVSQLIIIGRELHVCILLIYASAQWVDWLIVINLINNLRKWWCASPSSILSMMFFISLNNINKKQILSADKYYRIIIKTKTLSSTSIFL